MNLLEQTIQLRDELEKLRFKFDENKPPESQNDPAFFMMVKEKTSPIYDLLSHWEEASLKVVKKRLLNIHPQQIVSTRENMELLLMHSYYLDARRKRYMELYYSVLYIFDQMIRELPRR